MADLVELIERLEYAEPFVNDPNKFAISRTLRDKIVSALRGQQIRKTKAVSEGTVVASCRVLDSKSFLRAKADERGKG